MARSSKPRRAYESAAPAFQLLLTRGGGAELYSLQDDECVWTADEDEQFREEFPDFLQRSDLFDILDYLEEVGHMTSREADQCDCEEEYYEPDAVPGLMRTP